jgi:hypothetical protein
VAGAQARRGRGDWGGLADGPGAAPRGDQGGLHADAIHVFSFFSHFSSSILDVVDVYFCDS